MSFYKRLSLGNKILLPLLPVILFIFIVLGLYASSEIKKALQTETQSEMQINVRLLSDMLSAINAATINDRVDFGVLHLIGAATILAYPFLRRPWVALAGWALLVGLGAFTPGWNVESYWLVWLGFFPVDYYAVDYFPLIPWFGVALLGVALGNFLYPAGQRVFVLPDWSQAAPLRGLRFLGRNSLPIYLLHQPVLFVLLYLYVLLRF